MGFKAKKHLMDFGRECYAEHGAETSKYLDCAAGINPFGHTKLIDQESIDYRILSQYPDYSRFKAAIKEYWKEIISLKAENIEIGDGSINLLEIINKAFLDKDSKALGYSPQFPDYILDVNSSGATYESIALRPENNYKFCLPEFLSKISGEYNLIYIDNPNNPTGQVIPLEQLKEIIIKAAAMDICVIIDEAYGDFIAKEKSAISLTKEFDNLLVVRSFSKGFGLAGLRVGYMIGNESLLRYCVKVTNPFNVNALGHYFATVALRDGAFTENSYRKIAELKQEIIAACSALRVFETELSVPICVLQHLDPAVNLYEEFLKRGIYTNTGADFLGLGKNAVRFRVADDKEKIIAAIKSIEKEIL